MQRLIAELGVKVFPQPLKGDAMYQATGSVQRLDGNPLDVASGRFARGADHLTNALAAKLQPGTVPLNAPVVAIEISAESIHLTTAEGTTAEGTKAEGPLSAVHVVLAAPPALVGATIDFTPPLPERVAGLATNTPVWMGATTKVVAQYRTAFWRDQGLAGSAVSHIGPMRELHDMSGPEGHPADAIFGFIPGGSGPTPSVEAVVDQLAAIFGPEASEPTHVAVHDWRAEAWTSPINVEQLTSYQTFGHQMYSQPLFDGRVNWTSTKTGAHSPGHIERALAAAERTVAAIGGSPAFANHRPLSERQS